MKQTDETKELFLNELSEALKNPQKEMVFSSRFYCSLFEKKRIKTQNFESKTNIFEIFRYLHYFPEEFKNLCSSLENNEITETLRLEGTKISDAQNFEIFLTNFLVFFSKRE